MWRPDHYLSAMHVSHLDPPCVVIPPGAPADSNDDTVLTGG
jgi:hypothetical protein